jgi:hypothetical protein
MRVGPLVEMYEEQPVNPSPSIGINDRRVSTNGFIVNAVF